VLGALTLLRPGKGIETLLAALPRVLSAHPRAQLAIFGEGPDLQRLRGLAEQAGISAAIHFMGPSESPLDVLRGMDVFVHPSWAESFPYVVLEAMSLGRPIVASDVGGIGEALVDGSSGLLVPGRDAEALSLALIAMLDDPDRSQSMGAAARRRADELFSLQAMVDRLIRVYDELVVPLSIPSAPARSEMPDAAERPASR
jgi:glycosyltransferase involved in cell wall biosynthesis